MVPVAIKLALLVGANGAAILSIPEKAAVVGPLAAKARASMLASCNKHVTKALQRGTLKDTEAYETLARIQFLGMRAKDGFSSADEYRALGQVCTIMTKLSTGSVAKAFDDFAASLFSWSVMPHGKSAS